MSLDELDRMIDNRHQLTLLNFLNEYCLQVYKPGAKIDQ